MAKAKETVFLRKNSITYTTDGNFLFAEKEGVKVRLDLFSGHYYKLRPYNGSVILEIDGLRMHLVRDFKTPLDYSKEVVRGLSIPEKGEFAVLDTCMGLGYTAIAASSKKSVRTVVTCEISEAVFTLAQWNPFSDEVFDKNGKIIPMKGDAGELIKKFESSMFSFIIHDPPRFSLAPGLYSKEFYQELFRVSRRGAKLFHYVGSVGKSRGKNIEKEVAGRLSECGFRNIRYSQRLQGIYAQK